MLIVLTCLLVIGLLAFQRRGRVGLRASNPASQSGAIDRVAGRLADQLMRLLRGSDDRDDVGALCLAVCAELRSGAPPDRALVAAAGSSRLVPRARTAAELGEPVPAALAADATAAASPALAGMAACWAAAVDSGAGLADGLERVAALSGAQQRVAADLATEIAAPRATARTLSLLPLVGIALGQMLGADPLAWLLGTAAGRACCLGGLALQAAGHLWGRRVVRQALPGAGMATG